MQTSLFGLSAIYTWDFNFRNDFFSSPTLGKYWQHLNLVLCLLYSRGGGSASFLPDWTLGTYFSDFPSETTSCTCLSACFFPSLLAISSHCLLLLFSTSPGPPHPSIPAASMPCLPRCLLPSFTFQSVLTPSPLYKISLPLSTLKGQTNKPWLCSPCHSRADSLYPCHYPLSSLSPTPFAFSCPFHSSEVSCVKPERAYPWDAIMFLLLSLDSLQHLALSRLPFSHTLPGLQVSPQCSPCLFTLGGSRLD